MCATILYEDQIARISVSTFPYAPPRSDFLKRMRELSNGLRRIGVVLFNSFCCFFVFFSPLSDGFLVLYAVKRVGFGCVRR